MKNSISFTFRILILLFIIGCNNPQKEIANEKSLVIQTFPERAKDMNIYEVNIRQYTPEGTIKAFQEHLPRLKQMGVDILWIMPIQPISLKNRIGPLGSYYSIQDYTAINPSLGTIEDFNILVNEAHKNNMVVIMDWVANHTGFDHEWIKKEGYHKTDSNSNIVSHTGTDKTGVADLNYDNQEMRQAMISEMKWWITESDIDGFRCDDAGEVPNDFWSSAIDSLKAVKDVFMLAEWDDPKMHDAGFHMTYGWAPHHWMNETAKGNIDVDSLEALITSDVDRYGTSPFRMMFTTNHDENSWNGTVFERFGEGHQAWATWAFTVRGMPLINSGQEAGLDKRLRFYDKDTIDWSIIPFQDFYTHLLDLKHNNPALHNGRFGGNLKFIEDSNNHVSTFIRNKEEKAVIVIVNLSNEKQEIVINAKNLDNELSDWMTGVRVKLTSGEKLTLAPYQYYIFTISG